jgi:hypothetical protein
MLSHGCVAAPAWILVKLRASTRPPGTRWWNLLPGRLPTPRRGPSRILLHHQPGLDAGGSLHPRRAHADLRRWGPQRVRSRREGHLDQRRTRPLTSIAIAEVSGSRKAPLTWENAYVQASIQEPSSEGLSMAKATRLIRPRAGLSQVLASAPRRRHDPGVTLVQLAIVSTVTVTLKKQGGATRR